MTNAYDWQQQPGGLWLKVSPFDKSDAEHRDAAVGIMRSTIQTVAQQHGADFDEKGFRNNMQAVYNGDLQVDLYLAKWDVCERKPVYLGAALGWETYGFTPEGDLARSFYTEDVCILRRQLRQLAQDKPQDQNFPQESLSGCLERINLVQKAEQGMVYRFGEVDRDNTTMMRQLVGNGANMGTGFDSAVLEYRQIPGNLLGSFPMNVKALPVTWNGEDSKRNFRATYKENGHDVRLIATLGQATALGRRRVDIKVWHNGNLPEPGILDCVINSALLEIKRKVEEPRLTGAVMPSPSIPLVASREEQFGALYGAAGSEVGFNHSGRPSRFGKPMRDAHVFIQDDQWMLRAFVTHGAEPRLFGDKPMVPGVNVLQPMHLIQ